MKAAIRIYFTGSNFKEILDFAGCNGKNFCWIELTMRGDKMEVKLYTTTNDSFELGVGDYLEKVDENADWVY